MDLEPFYPLLSTLKPAEQVVFIHLFRHTLTDDDTVLASYKQLMVWTGIKSINTIKSALKGLREKTLVFCLKPGYGSAAALYRVGVGDQGAGPSGLVPEVSANISGQDEEADVHSSDLVLSSDNLILVSAIKKGFSPTRWVEMRSEARASKISIDALILQLYFGPGRLNG